MRTSSLVAALIAVTLFGCSSSDPTANPAPASTTTTLPPGVPTTAAGDPNLTPNPIPFNVGELVARANDWQMQVTKVTRPATDAGLPALPAGQEYVGVDIMLVNGGREAVTIDAHKVFSIADEQGRRNDVVSGAKGATGFDAPLAVGATLNGHLVFAVPTGQDLLMGLDGPEINTQRTVFQIDPPTHPVID